MKKLCFTIGLLLTTITAQSRDNFQVVWPFSMSDTVLQPTRATVEEANRLQDRHTFVVVNRPGAGASIAAKFVETTPNSLLSGSTSFFVRPNFFPKESQDPANFRPLMVQCAMPMVIVSGKYKNFNDIPKDANLTIGVSGMGVTTHLVATEVQKRFANLQVVPYRGSSEPMIDLVEGRVDMGVTFPNTAEQWLASGKLHGLGTTGPQPVLKMPTLVSLGFAGMQEVVNTTMFVVPRSMPENQYRELRDIMQRAARSASVQSAYAKEFCVPVDLNEEQMRAWWTGQLNLWKRLTQNVKLDGTK